MKYCVIGRKGFLGSALAARLGPVTSCPTRDTKVLFHFGSHVHPDFEQNPHYFMKQSFDSYSELLPYCHEHGILFVYPSSALVYEKETQFSRFKKTLESMAQCYDTISLGLRIFPVYGPHDHGTVIRQWCEQMSAGERPVVYGDGSQERDFIYIDDVVDQILSLVNQPRWSSAVVDIGSGQPLRFNDIVDRINEILQTKLAARYVAAPAAYPMAYVCRKPLSTKVSLADGIRRILAVNSSSELMLA